LPELVRPGSYAAGLSRVKGPTHIGSSHSPWMGFSAPTAVVDEHGIRIRNFGRGRFIRWQDVVALSCEVHDVRLGFPLYTPVVWMAAPSEPPNAGSIPLTALGSYRSMVAQRRTEALATFVPPQPSRTDG
jgi:hypothetical protein